MKLPKSVLSVVRGIGGAAILATVATGCATGAAGSAAHKPSELNQNGPVVQVATTPTPVAEPEPEWDYDPDIMAACGRG